MTGERRLIKASSLARVSRGATHQLDDLDRECNARLAAARQQAESILSTAEAAAEDVRREGYAQGYAAGQEAAMVAAGEHIAREAEREAGERIRSALPALQALATEVVRLRDEWLQQWEAGAIRLSAAIAERIVRCEVARRPAAVVELVRDALRVAAGWPQVTVLLHPEDCQRLSEVEPELLAALGPLEARLVPASDVTRGGCEIQSSPGTIDARIETQVSRIVEELLA